MTNQSIPKLSFPIIETVILENFSLFTSTPRIEVSVKNGVFCLAGANGLGKSTFLSALNYALTGVVPDPKRSYDSVDEYYKFNKNYAMSYFSGRISENDRDIAQITLCFRLGSYSYTITRGMFEPDTLRKFILIDNAHNNPAKLIDTDDLSGEEKHELYSNNLITHIGVATFQQFVFLQHFVFTFDESRHLLFWDQRVLEQALLLCFGFDFNEAQRADKLKREAEKAGSLARNSNWQASEIRNKINSLMEEIKNSKKLVEEEIRDLPKEHELLQANVDKLEKEIQSRKESINDNLLQLNELTAETLSLRNSYTEAFSKHLLSKVHVSQHPVVTQALNESHCSICGAQSRNLTKEIQSSLHQCICPFCKTKLQVSSKDKNSVHELKEIDKRLLEVTRKIETMSKTNRRLQTEIENIRPQLDIERTKLRKFEEDNETSLELQKYKVSSLDGVNSIISSYKIQMEEFLNKKTMYYQKRNEKLSELSKIQIRLERQYNNVEAEFVPIFRTLANLFIGLQLDVRMVTKGNSGVNLVVDVNGTSRREYYQLSESQRYFIDIALRMALAQFVSTDYSKATLFIDTPEGSLDIAYESRAGLMLAKFAESGHSIIMTANINTSKLLQSMARECTSSRMQLVRMTDWTMLSEVQIAEETLFDQAYLEIDNALKGI